MPQKDFVAAVATIYSLWCVLLRVYSWIYGCRVESVERAGNVFTRSLVCQQGGWVSKGRVFLVDRHLAKFRAPWSSFLLLGLTAALMDY